VDYGRRLCAQDEEDLLLIAKRLVVLRDAAARRDRDEVDAERAEPERAPDERPVAVPFGVIAVDERVGGHRFELLSRRVGAGGGLRETMPMAVAEADSPAALEQAIERYNAVGRAHA